MTSGCTADECRSIVKVAAGSRLVVVAGDDAEAHVDELVCVVGCLTEASNPSC